MVCVHRGAVQETVDIGEDRVDCLRPSTCPGPLTRRDGHRCPSPRGPGVREVEEAEVPGAAKGDPGWGSPSPLHDPARLERLRDRCDGRHRAHRSVEDLASLHTRRRDMVIEAGVGRAPGAELTPCRRVGPGLEIDSPDTRPRRENLESAPIAANSAGVGGSGNFGTDQASSPARAATAWGGRPSSSHPRGVIGVSFCPVTRSGCGSRSHRSTATGDAAGGRLGQPPPTRGARPVW